MPALNFQKRFAPLVESGQKRQTIRKHRKDGRATARVGSKLYLYTGMRTKSCRKLGEAVCNETRPFSITEDHAFYLNGILLLSAAHENEVARCDGFECAEEMVMWFIETHGLPFKGTLIEWEFPSPKDTGASDVLS